MGIEPRTSRANRNVVSHCANWSVEIIIQKLKLKEREPVYSESAASRNLCQLRSAQAVNRTRDEGLATHAYSLQAMSLTSASFSRWEALMTYYALLGSFETFYHHVQNFKTYQRKFIASQRT